MTAEIDRLHALDAVRVIALLLGIVLHGAMSFMMPIPALDSSQSTTLAVAFYVIHIFRMSAFYLIAGFFARMVVERRGVEAFIKDRAKRIVIPMIGLWPVLLALIVPVIIWGTAKTFPEGPPPGLESPTLESSRKRRSAARRSRRGWSTMSESVVAGYMVVHALHETHVLGVLGVTR